MIKPNRRGFLSGALFSGLAMTVPFKLLPQKRLIVEPSILSYKNNAMLRVGIGMDLSSVRMIPLSNLTLPIGVDIINPIDVTLKQNFLETPNGDWIERIPTNDRSLSMETYFIDEIYDDWFHRLHDRKETTIALKAGDQLIIADGRIRSLSVNQTFYGW